MCDKTNGDNCVKNCDALCGVFCKRHFGVLQSECQECFKSIADILACCDSCLLVKVTIVSFKCFSSHDSESVSQHEH